MTGDITKIKARLHSKKFASEYPRYSRDDTTLHEVPSSDHNILKYVPPVEGHVYCVASAEPRSEYVKAFEIDLEEVLPEFNQLLIYRIFRLLYDRPDILSAHASPSGGTALPVDWGYSFSIQPDLIGEVRNRFMSRVYLSFWLPEIPAAVSDRKRLGEAMAKCLKNMRETINKNLHLWDEKEELKGRAGLSALVNVPAEKYKGGELLLSKAREFDHRPLREPLEWGVTRSLESTGHLYLSAAIMFFVSFESFVNLLYRLLLRKEFKGGTYERLTVRSDLDLRLVSMHVFCLGFISQTIQPGSDLWTRMIQLRDFRNDIVHGNITEEHECHMLEDDGFQFFYSPAGDFRGRRSQRTVSQNLTRFQPNIREATVETTKQTVDELRSAIISAMDPTTREWVYSWLWQPLIPTHDPEGP